jgi:hypothetical protein
MTPGAVHGRHLLDGLVVPHLRTTDHRTLRAPRSGGAGVSVPKAKRTAPSALEPTRGENRDRGAELLATSAFVLTKARVPATLKP